MPSLCAEHTNCLCRGPCARALCSPRGWPSASTLARHCTGQSPLYRCITGCERHCDYGLPWCKTLLQIRIGPVELVSELQHRLRHRLHRHLHAGSLYLTTGKTQNTFHQAPSSRRKCPWCGALTCSRIAWRYLHTTANTAQRAASALPYSVCELSHRGKGVRLTYLLLHSARALTRRFIPVIPVLDLALFRLWLAPLCSHRLKST